MQDYVEEVFCAEIARQGRFALIAATELENALARGDAEFIWYRIQSLLIAIGNVSKLVWPAASNPRGHHLQRLLGVSHGSPLSARRFRNHFEHFDERLDKWSSNAPPIFIDSNIKEGELTKHVTGLPEGTLSLRHFNPESWSLEFMGEHYELRPVLDEIRRILPIAQDHTWDD